MTTVWPGEHGSIKWQCPHFSWARYKSKWQVFVCTKQGTNNKDSKIQLKACWKWCDSGALWMSSIVHIHTQPDSYSFRKLHSMILVQSQHCLFSSYWSYLQCVINCVWGEKSAVYTWNLNMMALLCRNVYLGVTMSDVPSLAIYDNMFLWHLCPHFHQDLTRGNISRKI